ncbi:MAG: hypothetical protein KDD50_08430 [Bdellovibrionales bacterium]|nr:hypothetical protein [Bdellovibrionales bacterium]
MSYEGKLLLDFQNHWGNLRELLHTWKYSRVTKLKSQGWDIEYYSPWICENKDLSKRVELHLIDDKKILSNNPFFIQTLIQIYKTETDKPLGLLNQRTSSFLYRPVQDVTSKTLEIFEQAHHLVCQSKLKSLYLDFIQKIIPLEEPGTQKSTGIGFSTIRSLGVVFLSLPNVAQDNQAYDLAINLAHELGHQCLYFLQLGDQIIDPNFNENIFSTIRNEYRPPIMALHGLVALTFINTMIEELLTRRGLNFIQRRFLEERSNLYRRLYHTAAIEFIDCPLTPFGQNLVNEIYEHSLVI